MVIGVTGTKGKSTTASLITKIIKRSFFDVRLVGNIGLPALDHLTEASKETIFVAELSSHQLVDSRYSPHIAVILDVVPEHLDYYPDFDRYIDAKSHIVRHQSDKDMVIYNPIHPVTGRITKLAKSHKYRFGLSPAADLFGWVDGDVLYVKRPTGKAEPILTVNEIPLLGRGNLENTLASIS